MIKDNPYFVDLNPDPIKDNPYYKPIKVVPFPRTKPMEEKPVEGKPTEQVQTTAIPDKWTFEITGNSIEEVNSKVDYIKLKFPDVPIEETNGIRNIRIKGNPELSKKVFRYLKNIPETQEQWKEFILPEQEITSTPIDKGFENQLFDIVAGLATDYSDQQDCGVLIP